MQRISFAHIKIQGINVAVFAANGADNTDRSRAEALGRLTALVREQGLRVDKSALAYRSGSRTCFYGTSDLVRYLSRSGAPSMTHQLTV